MVWWWVLNHAILLGSLIKFGFVLSTIQSAIKATNAKGKKDKKKPKKNALDPVEDEPAVDGEGEAPSKGPVEMTAEELADEEWGAVKEKGKKSKKGKGKKGKAQEEEEDETPGMQYVIW